MTKGKPQSAAKTPATPASTSPAPIPLRLPAAGLLEVATAAAVPVGAAALLSSAKNGTVSLENERSYPTHVLVTAPPWTPLHILSSSCSVNDPVRSLQVL